MRPVLLMLAVLLASCTRSGRQEPRVTGGPALFEAAFVDGARTRGAGGEMTFTRKRVGALRISSGRIVACDPLVLDDPQPLATEFPVGRFPVEVAVARIATDERVAFARILFSDRPVVRWAAARVVGQYPARLEPGEVPGYPVDSGTGSFMDRAAAVALAMRMAKDESYSETIAAKMQATYRPTWSAILWDVDDENAALFDSGYGDGSYASYVGYDANGRIARLLTDFDVAEWRREPGR